MRILYKIFFIIALIGNCHASKNLQDYTLQNGLRVIIKQDNRAPGVVCMLWYKIGAADEPPSILGISHALEHLMFKGTKTIKAGEFSKVISLIGGNENAFTNYDHTVYFEKIINYQLPIVLKLESDRMQNLDINKNDFEKEMQVIEEERHMRIDNNPQGILTERFMSAAYINTPYRNPIIGWPDTIKKINLQQVKSWYENFYNPNNAILVIVGAINPSDVALEVNKYFADIKKNLKLPNTKYKEPQALGSKIVNVKTNSHNQTIMMGYTVPSIGNYDSKQLWEPYALDILAYILDGGESARLTKNLVNKKRIANAVQVYYDFFLKQQSQFILIAIPADQVSLTDLQKALEDEIKHLQTHKLSNKELNKIKQQIIAQTIYNQDSMYDVANQLGLFASLDLSLDFDNSYIKMINSITPLQIQQVVKKYLTSERQTIANLIE